MNTEKKIISVNEKIPSSLFQKLKESMGTKYDNPRFLILFFYPKDDTPGCTQEAKDFRDLYTDFKNLNCEIIGISRDTIKSHENFSCKYQLSFPLYSDQTEELCHLFDVIRQKNLYGKLVRGIERSTFIIDSNQNLIQEWRKVKVEGHAEAVLQVIKNME